MKKVFLILAWIIVLISSCKKDDRIENGLTDNHAPVPFSATPYLINYPFFWSKHPILMPANNPLTVEGVTLGRKLFYDPVLSQNNSMSCATCHNIAYGFTDNGKQFSNGLHGETGVRNAPPLFNLGWFTNYGVINHRFFWDGGSADLESQIFGPIQNPNEMNETLFNVINKLKSKSEYPLLFKKAFGTDSITSQLLAFAIAQFERTIISGNTKFDQGRAINFTNFTPQEYNGFVTFTSEKGDCFHCHTIADPSSSMAPDFSTDFNFHNNGLQVTIVDSGQARITNIPGDMGKFKTPSLRNLVFTAPYMHDGRFSTLEQVIEFYNSSAHQGTNADPFIMIHPDGLNLSDREKQELVAFLKTLTDSSLIVNPAYTKP